MKIGISVIQRYNVKILVSFKPKALKLIFKKRNLKIRQHIRKMSNTQLSSASSYDVSNMIFTDPVVGTIPDSKPQISYRRVNIQTRNADGTIGELIFPTEPNLFSFGVSENKSIDSDKINGYVLPVCLYNRENPTEGEKQWVKKFDDVVEKCKDHLLENRESLEQYELERNDLKKFNPLYWKRDKGRIVEGTGPTLYAKLIQSKKMDKIVTMFFASDGSPLNPLELIGKYCSVRAAIKIESIFFGTKLSLQVKLYECEVKLLQTGMPRLLARGEDDGRLLNRAPQASSSFAKVAKPQTQDDDDTGSLKGDDDGPSSSTPAPTPARVVRKVRKPAS
jgi:hypothetical protein